MLAIDLECRYILGGCNSKIQMPSGVIAWRRFRMNSVYKVIEIIGTSDDSWEDAARNAIETASKSLKDIRVAEVKEMDISVDNNRLVFRVKLRVSFKFVD